MIFVLYKVNILLRYLLVVNRPSNVPCVNLEAKFCGQGRYITHVIMHQFILIRLDLVKLDVA